MPLLSLLLCLGGLPPSAPQPVKLALPGVSAVNVDAKVATFLGEHLAQLLKEAGVEVVTQREISSLLGLERQKEMLGCTGEVGGCIAELANALGADAVVLIDVARLNEVLRVSVKVISATNARTLGSFADSVKTENEAAEAITRRAGNLAREVRVSLGRPLPADQEAVASSEPSLARRYWWAPVGGGVIAAGVGLVLFFEGNRGYSELTSPHSPPLSAALATGYRDSGPRNEAIGVGLISVGAVAVASGVLMYLLGGNRAAAVGVAPSVNGATLVFSGQLP